MCAIPSTSKLYIVHWLTRLSSWDRTSVIFKVGVCFRSLQLFVIVEPTKCQCLFLGAIHVSSCVGTSRWFRRSGCLVRCHYYVIFRNRMFTSSIRAPVGNSLLTKLNRGVKLWTEVSKTPLTFEESHKLIHPTGWCM